MSAGPRLEPQGPEAADDVLPEPGLLPGQNQFRLIQVRLAEGGEQHVQVLSRFDIAEIKKVRPGEAVPFQRSLLLLRTADSGEDLSGSQRYDREPVLRQV
jgi:hypothetical protein